MKYPAYVYGISIDGVPKPYIGISHNPDKRFAAHLAHLRAGTHPVEDFQSDYDASESKKLHLVRLDEVKDETERWKEHKWQLDCRSYERAHGYNYKDPTAASELRKKAMRDRVMAHLKDQVRKTFILIAKEAPKPKPKKRPRKRTEYEQWLEFNAMSEEEFRAWLAQLLGC